MAYTVEINGVDVEFENRPTEQDIDAAASAMARRKPESAMPKPVEGPGGAAFGVYRPAGRRPESQQDREASKDMALQTVRGIASNVPAIAGIPGTIVNAVANAPRTAQNIQNRYQVAKEAFTGQAPQTQPLPEYKQVTPYDVEYFSQLVPGPQPSSPAGRLAFGAGQAVGAPLTPGAVASAVSTPVKAAAQTAEGLFGGMTGRIARPGQTPGPLQTASSRIPLSETYIDPADWAKFKSGEMPLSDLRSRPIEELPRNAVDRAALAMAGNEIPAAGQGFRAFGEALGRQYKQSPTLGAIDIGLSTLGIPPPIATYRAGQGLADYYLSKRGFDPNLPAELQAARSQAAQQALTPNMPPALPAPAAGPVIPMGTAPRQVNIEGQSFQLPYQIDTTNSMPTGPAQVAQQAAAAKVQGAVPGQTIQEIAAAKIQQTPEQIAKQQAILDQIRARGAQTDTNNAAKTETARQQDLAAQQARWAAAGVKLPEGTPVAGPVAPVEMPAAGVKLPEGTPVAGPVAPVEMPAARAAQPGSVADKLTAIRDRLQPLTPEQQAAADVYNAKTPKEKAAQTRAENAAKPVAKTPAPVVKSSMPTKSISENNVLPSSNAVKIDQANAAAYKAQTPDYNIAYDVSSLEGKGKKAKTIVTSVNEQAVNNKSFKAQPDVVITEKITKTTGNNIETVFKGRTENGIPIEIENLNSRSYNGPKLYAIVDGKKQLIREWSSYGEELNYRDNDKTAKRLGINLKEMQHVAPKDIKSIDARGFKPDPETPFHHEYADPVRYQKYKTTGVDPKGVWETDQHQVNSYKKKQAETAAKLAAKKLKE